MCIYSKRERDFIDYHSLVTFDLDYEIGQEAKCSFWIVILLGREMK